MEIGDDPAEPADAFAALADGTRVDILRALWESESRTATFSTLREAVGVRDSGQFNYHLDKLRDQFVTKTDDGYRLTVAGRHVVGSLLAGAYAGEGETDPVPVDDPCPVCGGTRTFRYEDEQVAIVCDECGMGMFFEIPPGVFAGHETHEYPTVAERYGRTVMCKIRDGFCPFCEGRVETVLQEGAGTSVPGAEPPDHVDDFPTVRYECTRCGEDIVSDLGSALLDHPAVVSFYHDHGIDVREEPLTRFVAGDPDRAWIEREDPLRVRVRYEADGATLTLTVDENLTVIDRG